MNASLNSSLPVSPLSAAQLAQACRFFFSLVSKEDAWAALMDGSASDPAGWNGWVVMGFRARRTVHLFNNHLSFNGGPPEPVTPGNAFVKRLRQFFGTSEVVSDAPLHLPFAGGWLGALAYEAHRLFEPTLNRLPFKAENTMQGLFCEFEDWVLVDLQTQKPYFLTRDPARREHLSLAWNFCLGHIALPSDYWGEGGMPEHLEVPMSVLAAASLSPAQFEAAVRIIRQHIRQGDLYQANLSLRTVFQGSYEKLSATEHVLYERLCQLNPSPCGGIFRWPAGTVISNSPERLVSMDREGRVQTRPIAGTRGRGANPVADLLLAEELQNNDKELAEHRMLVDLARNDLGRVCQPGSVQVDELMTIERYSHVMHLVSNVQGRLAQGRDAFDVLAALFPGGTITGCPKIRCMKILDGLEPVPRGFYTGSMGYIDRRTGALDFNILIRSLMLAPGRAADGRLMYNAAIHAGAGIVADSVAAYEYRECHRKAQALLGVLNHHGTDFSVAENA
jgi:para-aminobenzoate synthetase component 1